MAALMPQGKQQYFTAGGIPLVGGKVYTYAAGTTTPLATYTDAAAGTPNTNPVILDSRGEASIFFSAVNYKIVVKDSLDSTIWTQDNLAGDAAGKLRTDLAASGGSALVGYLPAGTGAVATNVQAKLRESVSILDFKNAAAISGDWTTAIQAALTYAASLNGCTIFFPPGVYSCDGVLTLPGTPIGIFIQGSGRDNTGQSSSRILYTGTAAAFFSLTATNTRFISIDNISFQSTNAIFTGRLVRLNVFNLVISRCNFSAASDQAFALLDISSSVNVKLSTSYFRLGQYCLYGTGVTTAFIDGCNIGSHGSYGVWFDGCQGITLQTCAFEPNQTLAESNCVRAVNMRALTISGCWVGDVITSAGSPVSYQITFAGDGLNVVGNYLNGDGFAKQTSILINAASQGINVQGNYFSNLDYCLNLGAGIAEHIVFTGNRVQQCTNIIGGTVATGGNAVLQKFLFGEAGPDLNVTGSYLFSAGSGVQFGTGTLLDDYREGTFTPADVSGASLVFTNVIGTYTKVGQLVTCNMQWQHPVTADASQARISVPFTAINSNAPGGGVFTMNTGSAGAATAQAQVAGNTPYLLLSNVTAGIAYANSAASGGLFRCTISYFTTQ